MRHQGDAFPHAIDKEKGAKGEAHDDPLRQVAEDDEKQSDEQHDGVASRRSDQRSKGRALDHIPSDDGQNARQGGKGDIAGKRCGHQHEDENEERVQHAGDGTCATGADIGGSTGNRAGHAEAAEKAGTDVGDPLAD